MAETAKKSPTSVHPVFPVFVAAAGWVVPGLGHVLVRQWARGIFYFCCVASMAGMALLLRGHIFSPTTGDAFDFLGFLADAGAGVFFFLSKSVENGGPDISRAAGDYGTRFFAAAGVLNLLCALDAHQVAAGQKP